MIKMTRNERNNECFEWMYQLICNDKYYVIAPEEFGDLDDYETISLTYYADQSLADDNDQLEDDSVFVRNDSLKCDYKILLDKRKYSNVIRRKPVND